MPAAVWIGLAGFLAIDWTCLVLKVLFVFLGVAALALGGAVLLLIWISSMTPIHHSEEIEPTGPPPSISELIEDGATVAVQGEVETVHEPEWTTDDGSRPGTPWEVSGVPEDTWIQTPITIQPTDDPFILRQDLVNELDAEPEDGELIVALRGGAIDGDLYEIDNGQDREFESGDQVFLVLGTEDVDVSDPELTDTSQGRGWTLMRRYTIQDDTAILQWGSETYEEDLQELMDQFQTSE